MKHVFALIAAPLVILASFAFPVAASAQSAGEVIRQIGWTTGIQPLNCLGQNTLWTVQCGINTLQRQAQVREALRREREVFNQQPVPVRVPARASAPAPVPAYAPAYVPAPVYAPARMPASSRSAGDIQSRLAVLHAECNRGVQQACQTVGR